MSDELGEETEHTARYSDPITETGGWVGRGAVLYDTREPHARPCCARPEGRCLAHVLGVYEETTTGEVYYKVADGTWTTQEWIHGDDLLSIFEPAGWSITGKKPTYILTRECGVDDHHDLMTDGGRDTAEKGTLQNGRETCPRCDQRNTEKTRRWSYECHDCGHEWTDDEARKEYYDRKRRKAKKRRQRRFL